MQEINDADSTSELIAQEEKVDPKKLVIDGLDAILKKLDSFALRPFTKQARKRVQNLKELALGNRPPRIVVFGRRGAGKSFLINALLGKKVLKEGHVSAETANFQYQRIVHNQIEIDFMDTRGWLDGITPANSPEKDAFKLLVNNISVDGHFPDIMLYICPIDGVDSGIDQDLLLVKKTSELIYAIDKSIALICIVSKVDRANPEKEFSYTEEKKNTISKCVNYLKKNLDSRAIKYSSIIAVSSYFQEKDGKIDEKTDQRYNIEELKNEIIRLCPFIRIGAALAFASTPKSLKVVVQLIVQLYAATAAVVGAIPIPFLDAFILFPLQFSMLVTIRSLAPMPPGVKLKTVGEFLAAMGLNAGLGFLSRYIAHDLFKLIPLYGNFVAASIAYTATFVLGEAAILFFFDNQEVSWKDYIMKHIKTKDELEQMIGEN